MRAHQTMRGRAGNGGTARTTGAKAARDSATEGVLVQAVAIKAQEWEQLGDFTAAGAPREKMEKLCFATFFFCFFF